MQPPHWATSVLSQLQRTKKISSCLSVFAPCLLHHHDPSRVHQYKSQPLFIYLSIYLLATPQGMWNLSSLIRNETCAPGSGNSES